MVIVCLCFSCVFLENLILPTERRIFLKTKRKQKRNIRQILDSKKANLGFTAYIYIYIYIWQLGHLLPTFCSKMPILPSFIANMAQNICPYMDNLHFFYPEYPEFSINFWRVLGSGPKTCGWGNLKIFLSASGWGNVKNCIFGCASGWGNVKNCIFRSLDVLLAGEMLKRVTLDVLLAGEVLKMQNGMCFWLGKS